MRPVQKTCDRLRGVAKPALRTISRLQVQDASVLVMCAGFEDRATAALADFLTSRATDRRLIIVDYQPVIQQNRTEEIQRICIEAGLAPEWVTYPRDDRQGVGESIVRLLANVEGDIVIDISGMSRFLIVQIVVAITQRAEGVRNVSLFYAEALHYPPDRGDVNEALLKAGAEELDRARLFISSGVYDICLVPELSSIALPGQPIRSIVFPSFNPYQLAALVAELQPTWFTIINGIPPRTENQWRTEALRRLNQIDRLPRSEERKTSTINYTETLDCLLDVYEEHGQLERLVVSPTGSKMQTVAVGLFRAFLDDVQIAYPTPLNHAPPGQVTVGIRERYQLPLAGFTGVAGRQQVQEA